LKEKASIFAGSQITGDWELVMRRRRIGGTRESREGGEEGAVRKILRRAARSLNTAL